MATMATMGLADLLVFPYIAGLRRFAGFPPYIAGFFLYSRSAPLCWFPPILPVCTVMLFSLYIAGLRRFAVFSPILQFFTDFEAI